MSLNDAQQAEFDALLVKIDDAIRADHETRWLQTVGGPASLRKPTQGMFVKTGRHSGSARGSIGWIVQVRLKQGQFGSDNYILCHPGKGGYLAQHSNNEFYPLTPDEAAEVRPFFADCLPENQSFSDGVTLGNEETRAIGFLIEPPEGFVTRGGEGARMRMTVTDTAGKQTVTDTVFL